MIHRSSYRKTITLYLLPTALLLAVMPVVTPVARLVLALPAVACAIIAIGGFVCLWRDRRETEGIPDFLALAAARPAPRGLLRRLGLRALLGPTIRPGDFVRVRQLAQIQGTLDAEGTLEGLPFMAEMADFCGQVFKVHRRVEKINDMRHKTGLRRMHRAVTLEAVHCNGLQHGNCQAECHILWKDAWLARSAPPAKTPPPHQGCEAVATVPLEVAAGKKYFCQMTRLWEASQPMSPRDLRQDLRPLLCGNIGLGNYLLAILTRLFNSAQRLRGGSVYPFMPESNSTSRAAAADSELPVAESVRVRRKDAIARTLVNARNRGLWFDRDMIRFCGQPGVIHKRVDRVIHEATGTMVVMKTPCVTLRGGVATGEFLRLCPQHEYIFWREVWLERASQGSMTPARSSATDR